MVEDAPFLFKCKFLYNSSQSHGIIKKWSWKVMEKSWNFISRCLWEGTLFNQRFISQMIRITSQIQITMPIARICMKRLPEVSFIGPRNNQLLSADVCSLPDWLFSLIIRGVAGTLWLHAELICNCHYSRDITCRGASFTVTRQIK